MSVSIHRKAGETIRIGDVVVTIADCYRRGVELLIDAPPGVPVLQGELLRNCRPAQPVEWLMEDVAGRKPLKFGGWIG